MELLGGRRRGKGNKQTNKSKVTAARAECADEGWPWRGRWVKTVDGRRSLSLHSDVTSASCRHWHSDVALPIGVPRMTPRQFEIH